MWLHWATSLAICPHLSLCLEFPCFETLKVAALESFWGRMSTGDRAQVQYLQSRPLTWAQGSGRTGSEALPPSQSGMVGTLGIREHSPTSGFTQRATIPENPCTPQESIVE